jgi:hypothetical protein
MSEQEEQSIEKLKNFMHTLMQAGCTPEFAIAQGFSYAIRTQREIFTTKYALLGETFDTSADTSTFWMDQAALWLAEVTRDLRINPETRMASYEQ